jgi:putative addiction module component (TIGR02574 family)
MSTEQIVAAALKLDHKSRAKIARRLLDSLDELSEEEAEALWLDEAERRLQEMRDGKVKEIPLRESLGRARVARS